jgi:alpha/beta superfamily hydrolase
MKHVQQCLAVLCLLLLTITANAQPAEVIAMDFTNLMGKGKAGDAYYMMDSTVKKQLTPVQLGLAWQQLEAKFGSWKSAKKVKADETGGRDIFYVENDFQKAFLTIRIQVTPDSKIGSFTVEQVKDKEEKKSVLPEGIKEEEVTIAANGGQLSGTLALPAAVTSGPVVLIIAGSGPTDRNGNNVMGVTAQTYRLLAYELAKKGIASLRYDKRYIGASNAFAQDGRYVTIDDFTDDAVQCLKLLKADKRFNKVLVLGHSEGALIGMLAVNRETADAYISVCGAGEPLDKTLDAQLKAGAPAMYADGSRIIKALKKDTVLPAVPEPLKIVFNSQNALFIHSLFQQDPVATIKKVKVPLMVIGANRDVQVKAEDARLLAAANRKATLLIIDKMNHVLKDVSENKEDNQRAYGDPSRPISPELVTGLSEFINKLEK